MSLLKTALSKISSEKKASIQNKIAFAKLIESGEFGKEAQFAFEGVMQAYTDQINESLVSKTASSNDHTIYDENAARRARLDTLLRKQ